MFSITLSTIGINEILPFLIIALVALLIVIVASLFWISGSLGALLNGVDKKTYEQSAYNSISKLREIASLYPSNNIGIEARNFLKRWDNNIEPNLERLDRSRRRKKLRILYKSTIHPILEAYEQMAKS